MAAVVGDLLGGVATDFATRRWGLRLGPGGTLLPRQSGCGRSNDRRRVCGQSHPGDIAHLAGGNGDDVYAGGTAWAACLDIRRSARQRGKCHHEYGRSNRLRFSARRW